MGRGLDKASSPAYFGDMILATAVLAAALVDPTPFVCSDGPRPYERAVATAARAMSITQPLYVAVVENKKAPGGVSASGTVGQKAIAWIYKGVYFDWTIYIRYDMYHAMSCGALRLSALHEVCHIKLGHHETLPPTVVQQVQEEQAVDECVKRFITPHEWRAYNNEQVDADLLTRRERIEAPSPNFYRREAVAPFR